MKIWLRIFLIILVNALIYNTSTAQQTGINNNYKNEAGLVHLKTERQMIYSPEKTWLYNHHPSIIEFKGKLIAIWSNGLI